MSRIIDISPLISPRLAVFPGDEPFYRTVTRRLEDGDSVTLSWIRSTAHLGAHADAPSHYLADGEDISARSLDLYIGECLVVIPRSGEPRSLEPSDFEDLEGPLPSRVLVRTGSFPAPDQWRDEFSSLSPDLVDDLGRRGVRLIGTDTPSVDPSDSKTLDGHRAAGRHDMAILEGLILGDVPPGRYELVALPLKIEGGDGAPVRAILRTLD